jgi:FtsP/CotA-like multicopper oxidase with cupredoxin domain
LRLAFAAAVATALVALAPSAAGAATRDFWIAASPTTWTVAPNARDGITGAPVTPATLQTVVYKRYSRGWKRPLADNPRIPGPLLRARVGDRIRVHFKNLDAAAPHSMHFHGVGYRVGSDGAFIPGFSGRGADVRPGQSFTYTLNAGRDAAGVWPYHDHSPSMHGSIAGGMYGALSILGRHERRPDREFVVVFAPMGGHQTIGGRAFVGNTPVFKSRVGELVQWDVIGIGSEHHTFHVHGHRWRRGGAGEDTRTVGPAESFRVRWREDAPGTWFYHCHVEDHMERGMIGLYRVARR